MKVRLNSDLKGIGIKGQEFEAHDGFNENKYHICINGFFGLYPTGFFDIVEEPVTSGAATKNPSLPYRSHAETPDDILEWYGVRCGDSPVEMSKEIHMLRGALHDANDELTGKLGSALEIVELSRKHLKRIEQLMASVGKSGK